MISSRSGTSAFSLKGTFVYRMPEDDVYHSVAWVHTLDFRQGACWVYLETLRLPLTSSSEQIYQNDSPSDVQTQLSKYDFPKSVPGSTPPDFAYALTPKGVHCSAFRFRLLSSGCGSGKPQCALLSPFLPFFYFLRIGEVHEDVRNLTVWGISSSIAGGLGSRRSVPPCAFLSSPFLFPHPASY